MAKVTHNGYAFDIGIDTSDLRSTLKRVAPDLEKELRVSFKQYAAEGKKLVQASAPVRTGKLRSAIQSKTQFTQTKTRAFVTNNTAKPGSSYLWPQEYGRHKFGPYPPRLFITRAGETIIPKAKQAIEADVERVLRKIS
jgi:hypothetical protein